MLTSPSVVFSEPKTIEFQHALLACRIHYSDEQSTELSDIGVEEYMLNVWSGDERSLAVIHRSSHGQVELIALDDTHDAVINAELRGPPHCVDPDAPPIASQETLVHIRFDDAVRTSRTVNSSTFTIYFTTPIFYVVKLVFYLFMLAFISTSLCFIIYRFNAVIVFYFAFTKRFH